jgi:hypothetical protein
MEGHAITFERLEADYGLGPIRSVEVDHIQRKVFVVTDPPTSDESLEGASIRQVGAHTLGGSRVER